jgi:hypothetical protein
MRIYTEGGASELRVLEDVTLVLTPAEMRQLASYATDLVHGASGDFFHCHLNDETYDREITLVIVTKETKANFHPSLIEMLKE